MYVCNTDDNVSLLSLAAKDEVCPSTDTLEEENGDICCTSMDDMRYNNGSRVHHWFSVHLVLQYAQTYRLVWQ